MSGGLGAVITEELSSPFLKAGKAADTLRMKVLSLFCVWQWRLCILNIFSICDMVKTKQISSNNL